MHPLIQALRSKLERLELETDIDFARIALILNLLRIVGLLLAGWGRCSTCALAKHAVVTDCLVLRRDGRCQEDMISNKLDRRIQHLSEYGRMLQYERWSCRLHETNGGLENRARKSGLREKPRLRLYATLVAIACFDKRCFSLDSICCIDD